MPDSIEPIKPNARYHRPQERWVCGRASEGCCCPAGPNRMGRCRGYECKPILVRDRWKCTRPEQYGGPCDDTRSAESSFGPIVKNGIGVCCRETRCTPVLSLRAKRGLTTWFFVALTVSAVLIGLNGPWRDNFISPGPLIKAHQGASIASGEAESLAGFESKNCNTCHVEIQSGFASVLLSAFDQDENNTQSRKCLDCHNDIGSSPLQAHGIPPQELDLRTDVASSRFPSNDNSPMLFKLAALLEISSDHVDRQLACATCHKEHNGQSFDLSHLSSNQCQSCHTIQFRSFENGHPEFGRSLSNPRQTYPYNRRTGIVFDHERHFDKHFENITDDSVAPQSCTVCHAFQSPGRLPRTRTFGEMCAACHSSSITKNKGGELQLFGIPPLDTMTLKEENVEIENWPNLNNERPISSFMLFLVSGDQAYGNRESEEALKLFESDLEILDNVFLFDLSYLEEFDNASDLEAVGRIARSVQNLNILLTDDAEENSTSVIESRLRSLVDQESNISINPRLLVGELAGTSSFNVAADIIAKSDLISANGMYVTEDGKLTKTTWSKILDELPQLEQMSTELAQQNNNNYDEFIDWFESFDRFRSWFDSKLHVKSGRWTSAVTKKSIRSSDWKRLIKDVPGYKEFESDEGEIVPQSVNDFEKWFSSQSKVKKWLDSVFRISVNGWYSLESPRSIYHRPIKHGDPFLREWLDFAASLYFKNGAARLLFDELSGRSDPNTSPGTCIKCHSVDFDSNDSRRVSVNWTAPARRRTFTKFDHAPHLKLLDCRKCHRFPADSLDSGQPSSYLDSYRTQSGSTELGTDPLNFRSNFSPIKIQDCRLCHSSAESGSSCLTCHNYHVSDFNLY